MLCYEILCTSEYLGIVHCNSGKVCEKHTGCDRYEKKGLVFLNDSEIEKHARNNYHYDRKGRLYKLGNARGL